MSNPAGRGCLVVLADGTQCPEVPVLGHYCQTHEGVLQRDLEMFKILSEHFRQDLREFWSRNNFYLVVDAALVSIYTSQTASDMRLALGLFGLTVSIFWYLAARGSLIWLAHWRREIMELDQSVDRLEIWGRLESRVKQRPWESPSWVTHWLPLVFGFGWVALLLVAVT